jgi:NifU-like protein involved in Fe-S cluster formation
MILNLAIACGLIFAVGAIWFLLHYYGNPVIENPQGIAKVSGNCGDTMEIGLQIEDNIVSSTHSWTDGCAYSKLCVEAAAMLARDKPIAEVKKINMVSIMELVGQLPETHLHCAQLAEITLQKSIEDYISKVTPRTS